MFCAPKVSTLWWQSRVVCQRVPVLDRTYSLAQMQMIVHRCTAVLQMQSSACKLDTGKAPSNDEPIKSAPRAVPSETDAVVLSTCILLYRQKVTSPQRLVLRQRKLPRRCCLRSFLQGWPSAALCNRYVLACEQSSYCHRGSAFASSASKISAPNRHLKLLRRA